MDSHAHVAIFLCTYQGERFLEAQLDSIAKQTYPHWTVYVSDDGSTDGTLALLERYRTKWGSERLLIATGPKKGFVSNFMSLVYNPTIKADYYAFADQDDSWEDDKLARAVAYLETISLLTPALYCSRTRLIGSDDKVLGLSVLYPKQPSFKNALVQNIASGNTMVFNQATRDMLQKVRPDVVVAIHDWWTYLVVTSCGGYVHYDTYPSVRYRQHDQNQIGANSSWSTQWQRLVLLFKGQFLHFNELNTNALSTIDSLLTPDNKQVFEQFKRARKQTVIQRLIGIAQSGVFCQTMKGNIKLLTATLLNKI